MSILNPMRTANPELPGESRGNAAVGTFIVHVWREELQEGRSEWRGRVQDVMNGRLNYFRGLEQLAVIIQEMLAERVGVKRGN